MEGGGGGGGGGGGLANLLIIEGIKIELLRMGLFDVICLNHGYASLE